jgi:non-ribosomal peptide synthase protein (TIGR01720 family)
MKGFSIKSLAEDYRQAKYHDKPLLAAIQPGQGPMLILMPDVGGGLWSYRELWQALSPSTAVYALEPELAKVIEIVEKAAPKERLSAMMSIWKSAVLELVQDSGRPVVLLGLCLSGLAAWELASQLKNEKVQVKAVIALNTRTKLLYQEPHPNEAQNSSPNQDQVNYLGEPPQEIIDDLTAGVDLYEGQEQRTLPRSPLELKYVRAELMAWANYQPQPQDLRLWVIRPQAPYGDDFQPFEKVSLGWEKLALGGYKEFRSPGHHYQMLGPQSAPYLASLIERLLKDRPSHSKNYPLSPIQSWYFSLGQDSWPLYQSLTLKSKRAYPAYLYRAVLWHLAEKHPMLRAAFRLDQANSQQYSQTFLAEAKINFEIILGGAKQISQRWAELAPSLDQLKDPLITALLSPSDSAGQSPDQAQGPDPDQSQGDLLFLAINHLIIDGLSWRLLGRDFNRAMALVSEKPVSSELEAAAILASSPRTPELSEKLAPSSSEPGRLESPGFINLVQELSNLARDHDYLRAQRAIWAELTGPNRPAPTRSQIASTNFRRISQVLELSPGQTKSVLAKLTGGLNLQTLLLSALIQALANLGFLGPQDQLASLLIAIEGHGRDGLKAYDFSSVVGWFTSLYPLALRPAPSLAQTLVQTAQSLARVPEGGLGYGLLKHLADQDPLPPDTLAHLVFNYLGQIDQASPDDQLEVMALGHPVDLPVNFAQPGVHSLSALIQNGQLKVEFTQNYDLACFPQAQPGLDLQAWPAELAKLLLGPWD